MPLCIPSYPPDHSDHLPHTQASPTYIKTLPDPAAASGGARKAVQDEDSAKIAHFHSFGDLGL